MSVQDTDLTTIFLAFSRNELLNQYWPRLKTCVQSLSVEQVRWRPNPASSSINSPVKAA